MSDRDIAAAAEIVTGNAFRALRQQAKGLRRQAQRIKRLRARVAELEERLNAEWYGYQQCNADLLKAEAEVAALRVEIKLLEGRSHPGYVIGQHWLSTAYSRICAGEPETDVMRDYGYTRE